MLTVLALVALAATAPDCAVDRAAILALSRHDFDQVEHRGWRLLTERGCHAAAADLIAAYRAAHPGDPNADVLRWHEGQMRAFAGDYAAARPLLAGSRTVGWPYNWFGWNDYVDATVAFIDRDRAALVAARDRPAATPRPATHPWTDPDGHPIPAPDLAPGAAWPDNLPVVDALIRCFDRSYASGYGTAECYVR